MNITKAVFAFFLMITTVYAAPDQLKKTKVEALLNDLQLDCHGMNYAAFEGSGKLIVIKWDKEIEAPMVAILDRFSKHGIRCGPDRIEFLIEENFPNSVFSILPFGIADNLKRLPIERTDIPTNKPIPMEFQGDQSREIGTQTQDIGATADGRKVELLYKNSDRKELNRGILHTKICNLFLVRDGKTVQAIPIAANTFLEAAD